MQPRLFSGNIESLHSPKSRPWDKDSHANHLFEKNRKHQLGAREVIQGRKDSCKSQLLWLAYAHRKLRGTMHTHRAREKAFISSSQVDWSPLPRLRVEVAGVNSLVLPACPKPGYSEAKKFPFPALQKRPCTLGWRYWKVQGLWVEVTTSAQVAWSYRDSPERLWQPLHLFYYTKLGEMLVLSRPPWCNWGWKAV